MKRKNKPQVIVALDVDSFQKAKKIINKLYPSVKIFKVGSVLFTSCGPRIVNFIRKKGASVFLDLKFFDIPNAVSGAVRESVRLNVKMLTLHILGDEEMLKSAVKAAKEESQKLKVKKPLLIGVTVLTSKESPSSDVLQLAKIGLDCGLDGVVCSVMEAGMLREKIQKDFFIVTPGIRLKGQSRHDQKRTASVKEAAESGSDFLVIGRPILENKNPLKAVKSILRDLSSPG